MSKISIVGAGAVGAATAFSLSEESWIHEIVLVDINQDKAQGEALDIMHGIPLVKPMNVSSGDYSDTKGSDVVVITVGVPEVVGESRLIPLQKNTEILESIVPQIVKYSPDTILLVVSNPVDLLSYITYKISGLPHNRVIGLGTMLDTSRLRYLLSNDLGIAAENVNAFVVGEHGDSQVVLWSKTRLANMSLAEYQVNTALSLDEAYQKNIEEQVRKTAFDVWDMKGPNAFCVATAVKKVLVSIVRNENCVLPVSSLSCVNNNPEDDIYISYPSIINKTGNAQVMTLQLSDMESERIEASKTMLKGLVKELTFKEQN